CARGGYSNRPAYWYFDVW
nr:immunoglobulin heavy chain junction region [Mus musculus]MBK4196340.1 immunoglobulin heavy chain junction region [Mus musculus]MBK4196341.1 immunoglobulin heavy chain junction region [Mus musculus]